ncbi:MAG: FMN-binding protein, partial [Breznakibacter sp.]|nr:FMN-binding protein [Breznakibacter sp.]
MRLTFLIFILFLLPYFGFAVEKSESVHQPKALIKEVLKLGVHNVDSALTVIQLKDSTANCDRGSFYRISTQKSSLYYYVGRVNSCRVGGCSVEMGPNVDYEYFDYFIIFNEDGEVDLVRVFNYQATHG